MACFGYRSRPHASHMRTSADSSLQLLRGRHVNITATEFCRWTRKVACNWGTRLARSGAWHCGTVYVTDRHCGATSDTSYLLLHSHIASAPSCTPRNIRARGHTRRHALACTGHQKVEWCTHLHTHAARARATGSRCPNTSPTTAAGRGRSNRGSTPSASPSSSPTSPVCPVSSAKHALLLSGELHGWGWMSEHQLNL